MHYIRFLKSPKLAHSKDKRSSGLITAKITITTDLGESFLLRDISLLYGLLDQSDRSLGQSAKTSWRGSSGIRSLEISYVLPPAGRAEAVKMFIRPMDEIYYVPLFASILGISSEREQRGGKGGVIEIWSPLVDLKTGRSEFPGLAERKFFDEERLIVSIWEETGESIARHIWDAGLVLSAFVATTLAPHHSSSQLGSRLPQLTSTLQTPNLKVLELGAGCGIVGITLSAVTTHCGIQHGILLTDLPEASEILEHNLLIAASIEKQRQNSRDITAFDSDSIQDIPLSPPPPPPLPKSNISQTILNWSEPVPPSITSPPDLILISDCTYNPSSIPSLTSTLSSLRSWNPSLLVAVAMKIRHDSESIFFHLMREEGFMVRESCVFDLPVLGGGAGGAEKEKEEVEVWVFGDGKRSSGEEKRGKH